MIALKEFSTELADLQSAAAVPGADVELTLQTSERRTIGWGEGRPNINNASASKGACLRVIIGGRQGIATTTVPDPAAVKSLSARALEAARSTGADPHRGIASPPAAYPADVPSDPATLSRPSDEIIEQLRSLEGAALAYDKRLTKVVRLNYSEARTRQGVANSRGVHVAGEGTASSFSLELLAKDGEVTEAAWDYEGHRLAKNLSLAEIVRQTAENAIRSLGGSPMATGPYPVVLHPRVGGQLLDLIGEALSAEAVQLGRSFLRDLVGKKAASPAVTIVDDPFLPDGMASGAFDDEGVPHEKLEPVGAGILRTYFFDLRSAAREGRASNGRASKESFGSPPRPGPTNLFIRPGAATQADMLASGEKVLLLREVMGLHMADPITGEFSLGASGLLYERGKFSRPVRGITISGTLSGMLNAIEAVGNDLRFYGSTGSPSLLVAGLSIAGS